MEHKDEVTSAFKPTWVKPELKPEEGAKRPEVKKEEVKPVVKPVVAKPVVKEVKKQETAVELLLRLLRGHGHIFNSYEIKLLEGDAPAKKIVETYTDVKASRKLHPEKFVATKK